jgi:hypothetical protein
MNARTPGARRGAHRSSRDLAGALVPSLLAVLAVTALITALVVWRGEDPDTILRANASTDGPTTAPISSASGSPASTPPASSPPASSTKPPAPTTAAAKPADLVGDLEVVVLNQTRRGGLAATVADQLRGKGWTVAHTGNFRGQVPATTVYYPPGGKAAARAAAGDLPTEPRVLPRFGNLSTTRLTVVVTDSYPT